MKQSNNQSGNVSVCYKNGCIHASGKHAKIITSVIVFAVVVLCVGMFVKLIK
jgi:hypothetical protein